jgi:hypothetical protein
MKQSRATIMRTTTIRLQVLNKSTTNYEIEREERERESEGDICREQMENEMVQNNVVKKLMTI